jgi:anti-sigma factor RsiW
LAVRAAVEQYATEEAMRDRRTLAKRRFVRDHRWSSARLTDDIDGELPPAEHARVEEHVHWCPDCRRLLESLRRTVKALVGLRVAVPESVTPGVIDRLRREG